MAESLEESAARMAAADEEREAAASCLRAAMHHREAVRGPDGGVLGRRTAVPGGWVYEIGGRPVHVPGDGSYRLRAIRLRGRPHFEASSVPTPHDAYAALLQLRAAGVLPHPAAAYLTSLQTEVVYALDEVRPGEPLWRPERQS